MPYRHAAAMVVTGVNGFYTAKIAFDRIPQPAPGETVVFRESVFKTGSEEELRDELNRRARNKAQELHIGNVDGIF